MYLSWYNYVFSHFISAYRQFHILINQMCAIGRTYGIEVKRRDWVTRERSLPERASCARQALTMTSGAQLRAEEEISRRGHDYHIRIFYAHGFCTIVAISATMIKWQVILFVHILSNNILLRVSQKSMFSPRITEICQINCNINEKRDSTSKRIFEDYFACMRALYV